MCVDDLVCQGAEPLFFLDYIAVGRLDPDHIEQLVEGVAEGCRQAGCALIGGEMAEHPGAMEPGEFDLVGFAVGVAERDQHRSPATHVAPGDVLIGLPSPGLRSNGYSLARRVLLDRAEPPARRPRLRRAPTTRSATSCSRPSVIYAPAVARAARGGRRARRRPHHRRRHPRQPQPGAPQGHRRRGRARLVGGRRGSSPRSSASASVGDDEMAKVFNLGLGMIAVVPEGDVFKALDILRGKGVARREGRPHRPRLRHRHPHLTHPLPKLAHLLRPAVSGEPPFAGPAKAGSPASAG